MIKELTSKKDLIQAYRQVYRNKGAAGIDNVQITGLRSILQAHGKQYARQIERGEYQLSPILGVEIPKSNGKKRLLGIPQLLTGCFSKHYIRFCNRYLPDFQKHSYGSDHTAMPIRLLHRAWKI